jgi:hypothetical protein
MRSLFHWFYLLPATFRLGAHFLAAKFYWKTRAAADLQLPVGINQTARAKRRWKHYFFGTTYLSAVFCQLRGAYLTADEKSQFARLAALASAFDDSTDALPIQFQNVAANPEEFGKKLLDKGLSLHLLQRIYSKIPPTELAKFQADLHRVFALEVSAHQPVASALSLDALDLRTMEKGGYSVLLFRHLLETPLTAAERQALFGFGGLVQLCDDIFDVWFDRQNGICTLATKLLEQQNLVQLQTRFARQIILVKQAFRQIPGTEYRRETSLRVLHFLSSITRVCLQRYAYLEKKHGTLPLDDRRAMVVDMAHWRNRWRALVETLRT